MARARAGGKTVWLTAAELANRLRVAQSTLWQWNLRNYGPPAVRIGGQPPATVEGGEAWSGNRRPWPVLDNGEGRAPRQRPGPASTTTTYSTAILPDQGDGHCLRCACRCRCHRPPPEPLSSPVPP